MLADDLKIDSSENGKVFFTVIDEFADDKEIRCDESDKDILLEQLDKVLNDPKMVGLDFYDCLPVFTRGSRFHTRLFEFDENIYKKTAEWIKTLSIPSDKDVIIGGDGEPSMLQFNDVVAGMCDATELEETVVVSYNGKPLEDVQIRFSIWF